MADISFVESSSPVEIVGATADGTETIPAKVSPNQDLGTSDVCTTAVVCTTITVSAGSPVELKVGGSVLANRKFVEWEALGTGIKWGFTSGAQPFDAFKNQQFGRPYGPGISVWFSIGASSAQVAIAEIS